MLCRALAVLALSLLASSAPAAASLPTGQWPLAARGSLRAPLAWQQSTGNGVVVAVLDTGVQLERPELRGHVWTNPGEIPGNGRDDDGDGIVDDIHGADFVNGDGTPADDNGHGTHVAGIIAGHGLARGLAPGATILPVKVLGAGKAGNAHWLAQGIDYAVAHGARILNVSVNGDGVSSELEDAIVRAQDAGAVIVASAGNDGRDLSARPSYPVSYPEPAVIGVGATDALRRRAPFSNFGAGVDVTAPGADIISLGTRGLAYRSGTSMAAAYVSATLALESAAAPAFSGGVLRDVLLRTARGGAVDAAGAVQAITGKAPAKKKRKRAARRHRLRHR
jgi:subtilisin family serine protease